MIIFLALAIVSIHPNFDATGVSIRAVTYNSSAALAGIETPKANTNPMAREVLLSIDAQPIGSVADYHEFVE